MDSTKLVLGRKGTTREEVNDLVSGSIPIKHCSGRFINSAPTGSVLPSKT
jgi:hypothetical protein